MAKLKECKYKKALILLKRFKEELSKKKPLPVNVKIATRRSL